MTQTTPLARAILALFLLLPLPSAFPQRIRGEIKESEFERKLKDPRESAFSPWMDAKAANTAFRTGELEGNLLIALERNASGQTRMLHFTPPDGKGGDVTYEAGLTESELLERHVLWEKQGYNLLFAHENPSGGTLAVIWIQTDVFGAAVKRLGELGITPASVTILSGSPDLPNRPTGPIAVSLPLQDWTNQQGQTIRASVEGLENGQVKFVLPDGRKVNYPLSSLAKAEQERLTAAQSAPADAPPSGFSDWMSYEDYEKRYAEERAQGRYAIYVETNPRDEYRAIFETRPSNLGWYYGFGKTEESLREADVSYRARGLSILSLSYNRRSERYCAVWVRDAAMQAAREQLAKHQITAAAIGDDIKISILPKGQ